MSLRAATAAVLALALVGAAWAAAESPRAVTGPADVLAAGAVTGTGTINDGGQPATWHFEYVYTSGDHDYSLATSPQEAEASADDQPVSQRLDLTIGGKTYRYRLVLQTADAEFDGDWVEFTTPPDPGKAEPPLPRVRFSNSRLHIARDHTIPVKIGCRRGTTPCRGTVVLTKFNDPSYTRLTRAARIEVPGRLDSRPAPPRPGGPAPARPKRTGRRRRRAGI